MALESLPEELLSVIIRELDTKSLYNLYNAGNFRIRFIVRKCNFSFNSLASPDSLRLDFFKDIAENVQELNMCGVPQLDKLSLVNAVSTMKKLHTLDVTYTQINLIDLIDVYKNCRTLKNISVNFQFHSDVYASNCGAYFPMEFIAKCKETFGNFKNVHFVGPGDILLMSKLPQYILQKAKLNTLTYSVTKQDEPCTFYKLMRGEPTYCNKFTINYLPWKKINICENAWRNPEKLLSGVPFEYEFLFITTESIRCSEVFVQYLVSAIDTKVYPCPKFKKKMLLSVIEDQSSAVVMIWNKATTTFDDAFFEKVVGEIKCLFANDETYTNGLTLAYPESKSDWVVLNHKITKAQANKQDGHMSTKPNEPRKFYLNYDTVFKNMKSVQLSLNLNDCSKKAKIFLSPDYNYLKKLTYLRLSGDFSINDDFFDILFTGCENLKTLFIQFAVCTPSILKSLPLSRSLKNLRIEEDKFDFKLFEYVSQCKNLEIIQVMQNFNPVDLDIPEVTGIFKSLDNLFYLGIEAFIFSRERRNKMLRHLHKLRLRYKRSHLRIALLSGEEDHEYVYDPYLAVFKLESIKMIT